MKYRSIDRIFPARRLIMDDIDLLQALPAPDLEHADPLLLLHHWQQHLEAGIRERETGVAPHPHRGFSPVTFVYAGEVRHRDSRGNDSIVKAGGVQWMNAGMGLMHSERPSAAFLQRGGAFEIIQIWINTPASHKKDQPEYIALQEAEIPEIELENNLVSCKLVAGTLKGESGPVVPKLPLLVCTLSMKKQGMLEILVPEHYECLLYQLDGRVISDQERTYSRNLIRFKRDGAGLRINCEQDSRLLLICGAATGEPIIKYGPFVVNDQTEVMQALRDYRMGKMGVLIEEF